MDFKKLFENNKAVSPVIGVILMVAITVILAAAIGSSVFGQGTTESAPKANLDIKSDGFNTTTHNATIKIEHLGGEPINFASGTKVMASVNSDESVQINNSVSLNTLDVGDVRKLTLEGVTIVPGNNVNIKIIDVQTSQLICDKNVRF